MAVAESALEVGNLISGTFKAGTAGRSFESRNPAQRRRHRCVPQAMPPMSTQRSQPRDAFDAWRGRPGRLAQRSSAPSELLEERKEALAQLMTREMGKVLIEARGDVQEAIDMGSSSPARDAEPSARPSPASCATSGR